MPVIRNYGLPIRRAEMFGSQYDNKHRLLLTYKIYANALSFLNTAQRYLDSYREQKEPKALHYRDLLLYQSAVELMRNLQYTDSTQTKLTQHVKQFWAQFSYFDVWESNYYYPLGTIANYYTGGHSLINGIIEQSLINFWQKANIEHTLTPKEKIQSAYSQVLHYSYPHIIDKLSQYLGIPVAKRNIISVIDLNNIETDLKLGRVSDEILNYAKHLDKVHRVLEAEQFLMDFSRALNFIKPIGLIGVYQALMVEGYHKAANVIQSDPAVYLMDLDTYYSCAPEAFYNYLLQAATANDVLTGSTSVNTVLVLAASNNKQLDERYVVNV